jgi:hypothetical protein
MRRFVCLAVLLFFTVPFGASLAGCGSKTVTRYCNGEGSGPVAGQVKAIQLSPSFATFGESVNFGQIGSALSASATDCFGSPVSVKSFVYATSNMSFADINPSTGQVCGGTWNRFTGGGIPDYTICTAPVNPPANLVATITATADGATSNGFNVYVHPIVTSIVIGNPTANCSTDQDTTCCPVTTGTVVTATPYLGNSCLSQGVSTQLTARAYAGTTNITCQIGHLQYSAQNAAVLTIDENGVATAAQPGSTILSAAISNSGSGGAAGFYATCPPTSIQLSVPGQTTTPPSAVVNVGTSQPLVATVKDVNNTTLTGVNLTFSSTSPSTIPAGGGTIVPAIPGAATITASCQPPGCNPSPFSQIGLYGNGAPITSNNVVITAPGNNATVLYMSSTQSQYLESIDFSTNLQSTLIKLPYVPNSMAISQDGSTIYMGSTTALMTISAANNSVTSSNLAVTGPVLSISPDGSTVVVTDPVRKTVSLVSSAGAVTATYGGVGISAQWSPDSQTVYIVAQGNQLLVHSSYTGWFSTTTSTQYEDVAVTVPSVGAFFATNTPTTEARTYCPATTLTPGNPPVTTNMYYPVANDTAVQIDKISATDDGNHILGATITPAPALHDITLTLPPAAFACTATSGPVTFNTSFTNHPLTGVTASAITGVVPASNSALAFVTYIGTSGVLPLYVPGQPNGTTSVMLSGGATTAPVAGVFSTDNSTFYAGTSGDNLVHLITVTGTTATDTGVITPALPNLGTGVAVPNLLVQRPKKATS